MKTQQVQCYAESSEKTRQAKKAKFIDDYN